MGKLQTILKDIEDFDNEERVGKYIVIRNPQGKLASAIEEVIKMKELTKPEQDLVMAITSLFDALRVNIICDLNNVPDRIEVYRLAGR